MNTMLPPGPVYTPGEVLALLDPIDDIRSGLYVVHSLMDGWAVLRGVVDQEETETLWVTDDHVRLPVRALDLFMPVGIHLRAPS
jgi:hypothetical protein